MIASLFIVGIVFVFLYLVLGLILVSCVTFSIFTYPILYGLLLHYRNVYLGSRLACCLVLVG
jgi:hypothetical protein